MGIRIPQNPGIGGLDELTNAEEVFVTSLAGLSYVSGDILYHNGSNITRLAKGSDDHVLTLASGVPSWAASASGFSDPMTTRGDVIYKDASNNTTRLGIGTNGQVLTTDGTDLSWGAAGTGDALVANPLSQFATTTSAELLGVISDETGTGVLVFATSPTLVAPALGTPASGTLTNCSFPTLNQNTTGSSGSCTGNSATVTNATLTTALTVNTGTLTLTADIGNDSVLTIGGGAVSVSGSNTGDQDLSGKADVDQTMYIGTTAVAINRGTAALTLAGLTLTTPDIGTPSAGVLTNCTFPTLNQNTTGSAAILTTARTIGGVNFDGSANIVPTTITVADESADTTCFVGYFTAATGDLLPKTGTNLTFNSNTGVLTAAGFAGALTGNVTGNCSGSSGSCTGESATVATITGLAPDTATTQATQATITTCANLTTVGTIGTGVWEGTAVADGYISSAATWNAKIANVVEDTTPQLGGDLDLNQKYLQLDPTPTSDHTGSGLMSSVTVDVNAYGIGSGLHMDTDGHYIEADADGVATMPCTALALETGTGTKKVLTHGYMRDDTWNFTVGANVYVSTTAGTLSTTAPTGTGKQVQIVGVAISADVVYFNPSMDIMELT